MELTAKRRRRVRSICVQVLILCVFLMVARFLYLRHLITPDMTLDEGYAYFLVKERPLSLWEKLTDANPQRESVSVLYWVPIGSDFPSVP